MDQDRFGVLVQAGKNRLYFGFTGSFDEPEALPKNKGAFLAALKTEIDGIRRTMRLRDCVYNN
jgi:hypothetical protein